MPRLLQTGDTVVLLGVPDSLTHDLPVEEQTEIKSAIGSEHIIQEIDSYGHIWLSICEITQHDGFATTHGHSFCVTSEFVRLVENSPQR